MIDLTSETLVPLSEVPALIPSGRRARKLHIATVHRWALKGARGRVLETTLIGGCRFTSREALARFAQVRGTTTPTLRQPAARARAIENAKAALRAAGI